jgi:hypothetical protein
VEVVAVDEEEQHQVPVVVVLVVVALLFHTGLYNLLSSPMQAIPLQ